MLDPDPRTGTLSRRQFLAAGAAAAFCLGLRADGRLEAMPAQGSTRFDIFLSISADGGIFITTPSTELGQGVYNSLPAIVAEELDADWTSVQVVMPYGDDGFISPVTGRHRTANSESVMIYFEQLRTVGAAARQMLLEAAAARWSVPVDGCRSELGRVHHASSGRSLSYGELAQEAGQLTPPESPQKKSIDDFRLLGKPLPRKELEPKVSGGAVFGIDVELPGMLHAALRMPEQLTARLVGFDEQQVLALPEVVAATAVEGGVAIIAETYWAARQAADALDVRFEQVGAAVGSAELRAALEAGLDDQASALPFPEVTSLERPARFITLDPALTETALLGADTTLECVYEVPYLTHLTLEPMVCTALYTPERCEVWAPQQQPDRALEAIVRESGLPRDRVSLHITMAGGGFGRKWELDFVRQAVQAARAVPGRPVKLVWTREQDIRHDFYRPGYMARARIALRDGALQGMHMRLSGQSIWDFQGQRFLPGLADPTAAGQLLYDIYDFPNKYMDFVAVEANVPIGLWRSVSLSQNAFFCESAIDEAAVALDQDPCAFRRRLLHRHPRALALLDRVARLAAWEAERPAGTGLGIALSPGFASLCAVVAEVVVSEGRWAVKRLYCSFDCGFKVDPDGVAAQVEGGVLFGLSATLFGGVSFENGAVRESNFHDQRILGLAETPELLIDLVPSREPPGGAGEAAVPPVAPALVNAIHAATGRRIRRLPIVDGEHGLVFDPRLARTS